jgi:hypothetical protein
LKDSEGSNPSALCEVNPVVEQTVPRQNLLQAPADASSNYSRNVFYLVGPMSPCLDFEAAISQDKHWVCRQMLSFVSQEFGQDCTKNWFRAPAEVNSKNA